MPWCSALPMYYRFEGQDERKHPTLVLHHCMRFCSALLLSLPSSPPCFPPLSSLSCQLRANASSIWRSTHCIHNVNAEQCSIHGHIYCFVFSVAFSSLSLFLYLKDFPVSFSFPCLSPILLLYPLYLCLCERGAIKRENLSQMFSLVYIIFI